ncbi:bifunctional phosphatase PAP2/diacylglycerol kinase family protein [Saccharopolyspora rosea]
MRRTVDRLDRDLVRRSARLPRTPADDWLRALTQLADHSKVWFAVGTGLAVRRGPTRRAALRGVAAIAGTSALTNLVTKRLLPRRRPAAGLVPRHRRLIDPPVSSSFPSGHAAAAAAFTTAVCMEAPVVGAVLAPLALAVAYSRVHTGVHWPSDVATGALVGTGVGLATRRWWPVRPVTPGIARPSENVAALERGEGLALLVNASSGNNDHAAAAELAQRWPEATFLSADGGDLVAQLREAVDAEPERVRALGVAGGDGTVGAAAAVAATRHLPLVVVPAGTLNHFARDVGVETADDAARALAAGSAVHVDLGTVRVDGGAPRWLVNTASLGGYPDLVRLREKWQHRWGKWPAAAAALVRVLARAQPIDVRIDGLDRRIWLLFVGNSGYQPKGFAPTWRPRLDDGVLDIRYVRADLRFSRIRFCVAALTGAMSNSRTYVQEERDRLLIEVRGDPVALARDGEVGVTGSVFEFSARDEALRVYRPADR